MDTLYDKQIKHFFIQCKRGTISSRSGPVGHVGIIVFQMHQTYMIFASNAKQYSLNWVLCTKIFFPFALLCPQVPKYFVKEVAWVTPVGRRRLCLRLHCEVWSVDQVVKQDRRASITTSLYYQEENHLHWCCQWWTLLQQSNINIVLWGLVLLL